MGEPVTVPLWPVVAIAAFAAWSNGRWFVRRRLAPRHLIEESPEGLFAAAATERPLLAYYANAIAHLR